VLIAAFVMENRLEMTGQHITWKTGNVIEFKWQVTDPEIQETFVVVKTWFCRLDGKRQDEMRWFALPDLSPYRD
jgi:hypothetical protein